MLFGTENDCDGGIFQFALISGVDAEQDVGNFAIATRIDRYW